MALFETSLLEWDNFAQNVSNAFQDMRRREDLFDVTLSCSGSEGRTLQAHRALLSASSSFFQKLFCQEISPNVPVKPYIYLKGIAFTDLSLIMDFVYSRKVSVPKHNLESFLSVARELEINCLVQKGEKSKECTSNKEKVGKEATSPQKVLVTSVPDLSKPATKEAKKPKEEKKANVEDKKIKKKKLTTKEETKEKNHHDVLIKKKKLKTNEETKEESTDAVVIKKKKHKTKEELKEDSEDDDDVAIVESNDPEKKADESIPINDNSSNKIKKNKKLFPNVMHVKTPGSSNTKSEQKGTSGKRKSSAPKRSLPDTDDSDKDSSPEKLDKNSDCDVPQGEIEDPVMKKMKKLEKYFAKEAEKDKGKFELIIQNLSQNLDTKQDSNKIKEVVSPTSGSEKTTKISKTSKKHSNNSVEDAINNTEDVRPNEGNRSAKHSTNEKSSSKKKPIPKIDEPRLTPNSKESKEESGNKNDHWNITWPPEKGTMIATLFEDAFSLGKVESKMGKEGTVKVSYMKPFRQANNNEEDGAGDEYWVWPAKPDVRPIQKDPVLGIGPIIEFVTKVGDNLEDDLYHLTNFQQLCKVSTNSKKGIHCDEFDLPLV